LLPFIERRFCSRGVGDALLATPVGGFDPASGIVRASIDLMTVFVCGTLPLFNAVWNALFGYWQLLLTVRVWACQLTIGVAIDNACIWYGINFC
jgi:hypothetical protein